MSLLEDFVSKKSRSYVEPRREGTPKGSPIGLSKQKYLATLAFLYDPKPKGMKKIAQALKVSYGLLRKWSTEEQFKKQAWQHYGEFSEVFWNYLSSAFDKRTAVFREYLKQPLTQLVNEKNPELLTETDLEPLADFFSYHLFLREMILHQAMKVIENSTDIAMTTYISLILGLLARRDGSLKMDWQELDKRQHKVWAKITLDAVIDCLSKPSISHDDRAAILFGLKNLRESFEDERA
jgi:hypothetical protein